MTTIKVKARVCGLPLILALFIVLSACAQTSPAPVTSSQPAVPETPSQDLPSIIFPEKEYTDAAEFETTVNQDGTVTIKRYLGPGGDVVIPSEIDGKQVTAIGNTFEITGAFQNCTTVTSVTIPEGVTEIQDNAFYSCTALETVTIPASVTLLRNCAFCDCPNLRAVYFEGNAPQQANYVFDSTENVTMYYRDGTSGWSSLWHGRPTETLDNDSNQPTSTEIPGYGNTSTPEFFKDIGKTFSELKNEHPESEFIVSLDGFPDSAAVCFGEQGADYVYFCFGGQSGNFEKAMNECEEQIKCSGFITTANILFTDMEDDMSFQDFFSLIGVDDYEYFGEDTITAEGWLRFMYSGMEVMVNTNEAVVGGGWDVTGAERVKSNAPVSIVDLEILNTNQDLADVVMFD